MLDAVLWGALTVVLLAVAAIAVLAVTPVRLRCIFCGEPGWRMVIAARLLAGIFPPIVLYDSRRRQLAARRRRRRPTKRRPSPRVRNVSHIVREVPELIGDLLRHMHLRRLAVDADIGLGDPADTGQLFGLVRAARHLLPAAPGVSVQVRPDFEALRVSGRLAGEASFIPVAFIPPAIRFGWRVWGPWR